MATITDIKRRIKEMAPAPFQEFCDTLISKNGYGAVHGYGMESGTGNTTTGNPDTYFRKNNGKYVFVAYTIQQSGIYSKLKDDIDKCLDPEKTGLAISEIEEIICCHTSSNLSAGDDKQLHDYCEAQGISLTIWGLDEIANQVHNRYRSMAKDFLGVSSDTNQILSIDDFTKLYDDNGMSAPLKTVFQFREKEKAEIINALEIEPVIIITGRAGVGKTRLALEVVRTYALSKGFKLLCVKNNNLGLFDDLIAATEKPDRYLFFVDDANELAELNQILAFTTKKLQGYVVKVIVTVRDYAKARVVENVKEFAFPKIIEISPFSDDEIKGFIDDNLEIRNEEYIKHIIRIAEGNPRMAYMAGRLAVEKQNLSAIKDVSQLYDAYYEKYVNNTLGEDRDLCFTAGILSVVNAIVLSNISVLKEILNDYGISIEEFKNKIFQLSRLEVVEIQLNQVATLADQCLANYMLYYVFFQRKIIPLSKVLVLGYKCFRNGVLRAINTILNLFESEETKSYCEQEILNAWDSLKNGEYSCYEDFVKDFHIFRPEEAFLIAQQKIESISNEDFDIHDIDYSKNVFGQDESSLDYLVGYQYSDYLDYVMELLLEYTSKTQKTLVSGFNWLKNYYGVGITDYKYQYYTQIKVSEYLLEAILTEKEKTMSIAFQWAKYSLAFSFHPTEMGRRNTFVFYNLELKKSDGLVKYRKTCWSILNTLAQKEEWKEKAISFVEDYAQHLYGKPDREIVIEEIECLEQLLAILNCNKISFLKTVKRLLSNAKRIDVEYDKKWMDIFVGKEWELYQLLEDDYIHSGLEYEEYESNRNSNLSEYGKNLSVSDISILVQGVNDILSNTSIERESYHINQGLELVIQQFDELKLKDFLRSFILFGKNISINPWIVLRQLNQRSDYVQLLAGIKAAIFPQKNEWLFEFFNSLTEENVSQEMLNEFLEFLSSDSDKEITQSSCRQLHVLDKFMIIEPNIYPIASSIIFDKRQYSSFIVEIYFELLFHDQIYSPKELLNLYQSDLALLQDMYFYMLKQGRLDDIKGTFLVEFLSLGETWLQKYTEAFWDNAENNINHDHYRNSALWKSKDFMRYYDYIFYHFPEDKVYRWRIAYAFKDVLTHEEKEDIVEQHQREWLTHIIIDNANTELITIIFEFVCELCDDTKRCAVKTFLDNNSDFETFDELSLVPNHWSGTGSLVPAYQKQIDFLESLYPIVAGVRFLKHKANIKSKVERLQEMIKREEIEAICRNLYM